MSKTVDIGGFTSMELIGNDDSVMIQVYDLSGRRILDRDFMIDESRNLNLKRELDFGIYLVRVHNTYNDITKKVLIH